MELFSPNFKKALIFLPKEYFLYFRKELLKPGKQKFLLFFLYFGKELSRPKLKIFPLCFLHQNLLYQNHRKKFLCRQ